MLRIYNVIREFLRSLKPLLERIEKRDPDLGRQLRRASASVLLNVGEGSGNKGRLRTLRYSTALGSMRESVACLDVAEALGYIDGIDAVTRDRADHVIGTLTRLVC